MNKSTAIILGIIVFILLIAGCNGCSQYNGLVQGDQKVKEAWSNVETNYQRRNDLYSSVVKTVEASANFEKSTLREVVEARSRATSVQVNTSDPKTMEQFQQAQQQLQGSFSRLIASFEAYPNLKTTDAFQNFQTQIEGTENRINTARRDYNAVVNEYNLRVRTFPGNLFANMFGFREKAYYQADPGTEKNPDIQFNIK